MERVTLITILLVFLAGYVLCAWGVPLLDNLFNTIAVFFQLLQGKMAVKITEYSVKTTRLKDQLGDKDAQSSTHVVGFVIPDQEEEEEEYYEEDE